MVNGIRIAISKGKGGTVDKIEILEKTTIYFKDITGKYVDMIRGDVRYIEIWKASNVRQGKSTLLKSFKVLAEDKGDQK